MSTQPVVVVLETRNSSRTGRYWIARIAGYKPDGKERLAYVKGADLYHANGRLRGVTVEVVRPGVYLTSGGDQYLVCANGDTDRLNNSCSYPELADDPPASLADWYDGILQRRWTPRTTSELINAYRHRYQNRLTRDGQHWLVDGHHVLPDLDQHTAPAEALTADDFTVTAHCPSCGEQLDTCELEAVHDIIAAHIHTRHPQRGPLPA